MSQGGSTFVATGFEGVAEEFERNFRERGDLGAAFAVYRDGELVVDLWGGTIDRDSGRPWGRDTVAVIFSGTKALVALCLLILIDRGELDLDAPVARYWPEFGAAGKQGILVRHLVSHTAGLPAIRAPLVFDDLARPERMATLLAEQEPLLEPGEPPCYHSLTFGWLCGELVHRVDGRRAGEFFAEEVATPLGLDVWIGLPDEHEHRVATMEQAADWGASLDAIPESELSRLIDLNPPVWERDGFPWNSRLFHGAEIPGAGGIAAARSLAHLYGCLALGGRLDGVQLLSERALRLGRTELARGRDAVSSHPLRVGVGFSLQSELAEFGRPPDAFGHGGAGGSVHGAWPSLRIGFSYVMNMMRDDEPVDPRAQALLHALHDAATR